MSIDRFLLRISAAVLSIVGVLAFAAGTAWGTALVISGQTMEGDLELPPGSTVGAGYDVTIPSGVTLHVTDAFVALNFSCSQNGSAVGQIAMLLPDATLAGPGWQPSGDQRSPAAWQVPDHSVSAATSKCGGPVWVNAQTGGATLYGNFTSSPAGAKVSVRFHYRETNPRSTSGSWSATEAVTTSPVPVTTSQTLSAVTYLCAGGSVRTATPVPGGTVSAVGPARIGSSASPLRATHVKAGAYEVTVSAPAGYQLVRCESGAGRPSSSAAESVTVPAGGSARAVFYVEKEATASPAPATSPTPSPTAPAAAPASASGVLPTGAASDLGPFSPPSPGPSPAALSALIAGIALSLGGLGLFLVEGLRRRHAR